jgi:hypothetical protein
MGPKHPLIVPTRKSEVLHLTRLFGHESPDRVDITALLQRLCCDTSDAFPVDQKTQLSEVASSRMVTQDVNAWLSFSQGKNTNQTHDYSDNYYSDEAWAFFGGTYTTQRKFNKMSKEWLS